MIADAWERALADHPDRALVARAIHGIRYGVDIGLKSNPASNANSVRNHPSAKEYGTAVADDLAKEVEAGHMLKFKQPPDHIHISPIGTVSKKGSDKRRRITDARELNEFITDQPLHYINLETITRMIRQCGVGCEIAKLDVKSAFRCVAVRPEDRWTLGTQWGGHHYIDLMLPFGLKSSPALWEVYATLLEWILHHRGVEFVVHYVDDFVFAGRKGTGQCAQYIRVALDTFKELGIPVSADKLALEGTPSHVAIALGIELDTIKMEARLDTAKLTDLCARLKQWITPLHMYTKYDLRSLLGRLNWVTAVVPAGRAFLRRLIVAASARHNHKPVAVDDETRADLKWWHSHLKAWNGRSLLLFDDLFVSAPNAALNLNDSTLRLATDACRTGFGAACGTKWIAGQWTNHELRTAHRAKDVSMPHLELRAILIAVNTFATHLSGHRVVLYSDCQPAIAAVNGLDTREPQMMAAVRTILWIAAKHNFALRIVHIAGTDNLVPDMLSRGQIHEALAQHPHLDRSPTPIGRLPTQSW